MPFLVLDRVRDTVRDCSRGGILALAGGLGLIAVGCDSAAAAALSASTVPARSPGKLTAAQAWARLAAGNKRWVSGRMRHPDQTPRRRMQVAPVQAPFAVVVSCIDSRLPPEIIFDQGIGDLFAIRTGAETIDGLVAASIEYGPVENATPLIVVLGHQRCGAVKAAIEAIEKDQELPGHLGEIVAAIRPAYEQARDSGGDILDQTVRAQVLRTVNALKSGTALATRLRDGSLGLVGAHYSLDTGQVTAIV